jgi:hypothetical protein
LGAALAAGLTTLAGAAAFFGIALAFGDTFFAVAICHFLYVLTGINFCQRCIVFKIPSHVDPRRFLMVIPGP